MVLERAPFVEGSILICAVLYSGREAADEALANLVSRFGGVVSFSEEYFFDSLSTYYCAEMGTDLTKRIFAFEAKGVVDDLSDIKHFTNGIETSSAVRDESGVLRRKVNLDPGYLTPSKLVLASTKGYSHRVSIGKGIFAEVTLLYERGEFVKLPWTYQDYCSENVLSFLVKTRKLLLEKQEFSEKQI